MRPPADRRGAAATAAPPASASGYPAEEPREVGGWSISTGARANGTVLARWAAWSLLVLSPLLSATAMCSAPNQAASARVQPQASAPSGAQGAAGFAQLFVAAYLDAGEGDQAKLAAYFPGAADLRLEGSSGRRGGGQLTVVRLRQTDRDVWSVTVAAQVSTASGSSTPVPSAPGGPGVLVPDGLRYFQVPVASAPGGGGAMGYVALSMPAEVGAPPVIQAPGLVYGPMRPALPSDPLTQAVTAFLGAYLTGAAGLDRYLAPGVQVPAVSPAPYSGLTVDQLAVEGERGGEPVNAMPSDGTRVRLLVVLRATGRDGVRMPLTYALTVRARAGRWEIASVDGAPAEAAGAPASGPVMTPSSGSSSPSS